MGDDPLENANTRPSIRRAMIAVLPAAAGLTVIAWLAAHAAARVKLILLFPVTVGLLGGYVMGVLFWWLGVRSRLATGLIGAVLVGAMMLAYFGFSFLVWQARVAAEVEANLRAQPGGVTILERIRSDRPAASEVEAEFLAAYRERLYPPLDSFLSDRVKFPTFPFRVLPPWHLIIAGIEVLAATAAGGWLAAKGIEGGSVEIGSTDQDDAPLGDQP